MKYFIYIISIIILLGLNVGLFNNLQIRGQIPNLLLLLTLYCSLEKKGYEFFFVAFIAGIFLDFYSVNFFGSFTLAFLVLALAIHFLSGSLMVLEVNWRSLTLLLLASLLLVNFTLWLYGFLAFKLNLTADYESIVVFIKSFPAEFFYNWLLLYPMYLLSNLLKRLIDNLKLRRRGFVS